MCVSLRQAHLRRSWPFHGGELLRLVGMLVEWKAAGAVGGDPREVGELLPGGKVDEAKKIDAWYVRWSQTLWHMSRSRPLLSLVFFPVSQERCRFFFVQDQPRLRLPGLFLSSANWAARTSVFSLFRNFARRCAQTIGHPGRRRTAISARDYR